jgi:hypothetical protein
VKEHKDYCITPNLRLSMEETIAQGVEAYREGYAESDCPYIYDKHGNPATNCACENWFRGFRSEQKQQVAQ